MDFYVKFDEAVVSDPRVNSILIHFDIDKPARTTIYANYLSGSGTDTLIFRIRVGPDWQDFTGPTLANGGNLDLNGGSIVSLATGISIANTFLAGFGSLEGIKFDSILPVITSVGVPPDGTYGLNRNLDFTVNFDRPIMVDTTGGTPYVPITFDVGGTVSAMYISGSGSNVLTFRYVTTANLLDTDGIKVEYILQFNGGSMLSSNGNVPYQQLNNPASTLGVLVDTTSLPVASIARRDTNPSNASSLGFLVTFNKPVSGVDISGFSLASNGTAAGTINEVSGSGTNWEVIVNNVTGDGTLGLNLNSSGNGITDSIGNPVVDGFTGQIYTVQHTPPSASAMTVPANGAYGVGQNMDFVVTFTQAVSVTGTPVVPITLDTGGTVYANYLSGSGTNALSFRFVPVLGQQDLTGITAATSIFLNGGSIQDSTGNLANLALNTVMPSVASVYVDAAMPVITSVSVPANTTYIAGQLLMFSVNFNKPMTVDITGGRPNIALTLATGGTVYATYVPSSASRDLLFTYTVLAGQAAPNGVVLGSAINLNGGRINDARGNIPTLTLSNVGNTADVLVDAIAPKVSSITLGATNPTDASTLPFLVTFSKAVTGVSTSKFTLSSTNTVSGTVSSVSGYGALYTVTVSNVTGDGTLRLDLSTPTGIADRVTNAMQTAYTQGASYTVHSAAKVTSVGIPANGTYRAGQSLSFTVTFDKAVNVATSGGTPSLPIVLDSGGNSAAQYVSGSGSNALLFTYVIKAGDRDINGIALGNALALNGATIDDLAGTAANLTLGGVGDTTGVLVDLQSVVSVLVGTAGGNVSANSPAPVSGAITNCAMNGGTCSATYGSAVPVKLSITAEAGFSIGNVSGCAGSLSGTTYTLPEVTSNCQVAVSFINKQIGPMTTATGGGSVSAKIVTGSAGCSFDPAKTATFVPPAEPSGRAAPYGALAFGLTGCTPGESVMVSVTWPQVDGLTAMKYGPTPQSPDKSVWYQPENLSVDAGAGSLTYSITDNGLGDDTFTGADGKINDPIVALGAAAPVLPTAATPVPTLNHWMLIVLSALVAMFAIFGVGMQRRNRHYA